MRYFFLVYHSIMRYLLLDDPSIFSLLWLRVIDLRTEFLRRDALLRNAGSDDFLAVFSSCAILWSFSPRGGDGRVTE